MSRIGKLPIIIPEGVEIQCIESKLIAKGEFGLLELNIPDTIKVQHQKNIIKVETSQKDNNARSLHGLYRTLINNMIIGVSKQFQRTLVLKGVGYRASVVKENIILNLGYSHPVEIRIPDVLSVEVIQNTTINLKSCNKELLGLFASKIRAWRRPEPYKGKGILYQNEIINRKAGKSGK